MSDVLKCQCSHCGEITEYELENRIVVNKDDFTDDLLNMGFTKGYNKAIDDFAEQLRVHYALLQECGYVAETYEKLMKNVFEYAKQLKDGGEND